MFTSPTDAIIALVTILPCIACVAAVIYTCFFTKHGFRRVPLLDQDFLDFMPGIDRRELEEQLANEARWSCEVCAFNNLDKSLVCSLCHTVASKYDPNEPLTTDQRMFRRRNRWTREVHDDNLVHWVAHGDPSKLNAAWVVQTELLHPVALEPERPSITIVIALDPATKQPVAPSVWPDVAAMPLRIHWSDLTMHSCKRTILGKELPLPVWEGLVSIAHLKFSSKYAWFLHQVADMRLPATELRLEVKSDRAKLVQDATRTLLELQGDARCAIARHQFDGEVAIDAGAVQREWYTLVAQAWMDPVAMGLFAIVNRTNNSYYINPTSASSTERLESFRAFGRYLGRALLDGQVLPIQLNPVLFRLLLGVPVEFEDLEWFDPVVFKSLSYVLDCDDVTELALTFCAVENIDGRVREVDLIDGGRHICVDKTNRVQYVEAMIKHVVFGRVQDQLLAIAKGLYDVVPPELLAIFDHKELELILCGIPVVDVDDWKVNTVTTPNLAQSRLVDWFWEVVDAMPSQDQVKLLQFTTGSSRVPVQGFKGLTSYDGRICYFTLNGVPYTTGKYPVVHACFNRIDLPLYPTKELLQDALTTLLLSDPTGFNVV